MRLSRLLIAVAAAFSASAFAVGPPGSQGPRQDDDTQLPQAWTNSPSTEDRCEQGTTASAEGSQPGASVSERDENASLNTRPNDAWQSSAQSESDGSQEPDQTAMRRDALPSDADRTETPPVVRERRPAFGEQS